MKKKDIFRLVGVVLVIVFVIIYLEITNERVGSGSTKETEIVLSNSEINMNNMDPDTRRDMDERYPRAHEISTPDAFLNSDPFTIESLLPDHVVLVDFWTYSCINCQRTTPYLNAWHDAYADDGLVIVGIHTPEFNFEKDIENVTDAVERLEIEYPIVIDNDYSTWRSYQNKFWPRKYLIDHNGYVVYDRIGEGAYDVTEMKIVEALNNLRKEKGLEPLATENIGSNPQDVTPVTFGNIESPETYFGYKREEHLVIDDNDFLATLDACKDSACSYPKNDRMLEVGTYTLSGSWFWGPESITTSRSDISSSEVELQFPKLETVFGASKVNIVAGSESVKRARVFLDGEPISEEFSGRDVKNGILEIDGARLYEIVDLQGNYENRELMIEFIEEPVEVFTLTFG